MVFAHLAVIWKAPLPNNKLYNYLQGYDNLCMFCGRILQRYFPAEMEGKAEVFLLDFCLNVGDSYTCKLRKSVEIFQCYL